MSFDDFTKQLDEWIQEKDILVEYLEPIKLQLNILLDKLFDGIELNENELKNWFMANLMSGGSMKG